jgi:hypothetical protein
LCRSRMHYVLTLNVWLCRSREHYLLTLNFWLCRSGARVLVRLHPRLVGAETQPERQHRVLRGPKEGKG